MVAEVDANKPRVGCGRGAKWAALLVILVVVLVVAIVLNLNHGNDISSQIESSIDVDNGDLKINWSRYPTYDIELSESLTITKPGIYHLTGTLTDGSVAIYANAEDVVKIILDNVSITNSTGPAIACYSADDLVIELVGHNVLSDGTIYNSDYDEDITSAIYSKADLTFGGGGSLDLTANYQDGIVGKDDLKFNGGTYYIVATDDGIRGKDSVYIVDGNFTISANGDGIKSTNETDAGKGFVKIENGTFHIAAGDDGIHAIRTLAIEGGTLAVTKSYEGLEARVISISGGNLDITSSDDGINAGGGSDAYANGNAGNNPFAADEGCIISISGGDIYVNASGDGVDSNGWLYFDGGRVVVDGPTNSGNGALDSGLGIVMNGGTVIAVGSSGMAESLGSTSLVYNTSIFLASTKGAGTLVEIKNSTDDTIISHTSAKSFSHIAVGSPNFELGETYTIYLDGEEYQSFTISDVTTMVGVGDGAVPGQQPTQPGAQPGGTNAGQPPTPPDTTRRQ